MSKLKSPLCIDVSEILALPEGEYCEITIHQQVAGIDSPETLSSNKADITAELKIIKIKKGIYLMISGVVMLQLICARCLNIFFHEFKFNIDAVASYWISDNQIKIENDKIDIYPILCETVLLNIPTKPLCDINCKGICQNCGKNLNSNGCKCQK